MTLISKLYATGSVLDVQTLPWDEHRIAQMKESHRHSGATKGEVHGDAIECDPPRDGNESKV